MSTLQTPQKTSGANTSSLINALRECYRAHQKGQVSAKSLRAMSYDTALAMLDEYRYRRLSSTPQAVIDYRARKEQLTEKDQERFMQKWGWFFDKQMLEQAQNDSNRHFLKQLKAWAWVKGDRSAVFQIRGLIAGHIR